MNKLILASAIAFLLCFFGAAWFVSKSYNYPPILHPRMSSDTAVRVDSVFSHDNYVNPDSKYVKIDNDTIRISLPDKPVKIENITPTDSTPIQLKNQ